MGGALTRMVGFVPTVTDPLEAELIALNAAGKLVSSWFLPLSNPAQYLSLSGSDVTTWTAAYGSQKVNPATEVASPQWDASLFAGKGGVTFNGINQRLLGTGNVANWPAATDDLYMLVAVRNDSNASAAQIFAYGAALTTSRTVGLASNDACQSRVGGVMVTGSTPNITGSHTLGLVCDIGGSSVVYVDASSDGSGATASAALTLTRMRLGASSNSAASLFFNGVVAAAAIMNSSATLTDFSTLEALMLDRIT